MMPRFSQGKKSVVVPNLFLSVDAHSQPISADQVGAILEDVRYVL